MTDEEVIQARILSALDHPAIRREPDFAAMQLIAYASECVFAQRGHPLGPSGARVPESYRRRILVDVATVILKASSLARAGESGTGPETATGEHIASAFAVQDRVMAAVDQTHADIRDNPMWAVSALVIAALTVGGHDRKLGWTVDARERAFDAVMAKLKECFDLEALRN